MQQIYPQVWTSLPREVRNHLIKVFGLIKTGITIVKDQTVVTDGFTQEDLMAISHEKMCEYIGSQETFMRCWELTLAKCHSELHPPVGKISGHAEEIVPEEVLIIKDKESIDEVKKSWCDTCDSRGVRHLKGCPKFVAIPIHSTKSYPNNQI